mmetsp:Transcript_9057/g.37354  ORF Transcript_9057/g.37354 Transcript_9057/m.37354 type:complete len:293 (-) Transcript_9057:973-1851(-)
MTRRMQMPKRQQTMAPEMSAIMRRSFQSSSKMYCSEESTHPSAAPPEKRTAKEVRWSVVPQTWPSFSVRQLSWHSHSPSSLMNPRQEFSMSLLTTLRQISISPVSGTSTPSRKILMSTGIERLGERSGSTSTGVMTTSESSGVEPGGMTTVPTGSPAGSSMTITASSSSGRGAMVGWGWQAGLLLLLPPTQAMGERLGLGKGEGVGTLKMPLAEGATVAPTSGLGLTEGPTIMGLAAGVGVTDGRELGGSGVCEGEGDALGGRLEGVLEGVIVGVGVAEGGAQLGSTTVWSM